MRLPVKKAWQILRREGTASFVKKTLAFLSRHINTAHDAKLYVDVLFVNGCGLEHPYRYRVRHQMEQLAAFGLTSQDVWYEKITPDLLAYCRAVIVYRCPWTQAVEDFLAKARFFNKAVWFDIDDLVIDTKYTDQIPFVAQMSAADKALYDDGVNRYRRTMQLCDEVITTTEGLATELKNYMPRVFVNRNTLSEQMAAISDKVLHDPPAKNPAQVVLGYFSGSITHNDDYAMILPVLIKLLSAYENLRLLIVGELDLPAELVPYKDRVIVQPFVDWLDLPGLIAQADINLVPLTDTVFNAAKSENKWAEAALVKVPTVASDIGAFHRMIEPGRTGFLCADVATWESTLAELIENKDKRLQVGQAAYAYVCANCLTTATGARLASHIRDGLAPNVAFLLPSFDVGGGVLVALRHADILRRRGYDVTAVNLDNRADAATEVKADDMEFLAFLAEKTNVCAKFAKGVATMWLTADEFFYRHTQEKFYLVQGFETDFYPHGTLERLQANASYCCQNINYVTISHWCQKWLQEKFAQTADFAPNGLDTKQFFPTERDWHGKIRLLVEGDSESAYKNVDESFRIINLLPAEKYEVWYVSYNGTAKNWYHVDKFCHKVPYREMPEIYRACHILIKTSILESFSYPPLEMMATGGMVVVRANAGNVEYLQDGQNCLFYDPDDLKTAAAAIEKLAQDESLRQKLATGGRQTALERDWKNCEEQIAGLYGEKQTTIKEPLIK